MRLHSSIVVLICLSLLAECEGKEAGKCASNINIKNLRQ
jgi:hypothetical protein